MDRYFRCASLPALLFAAHLRAYRRWGALGSFLGHLEKLGITLLVLSALLFAFRYFRKRKACKTCGDQCNCKGTTQTTRNQYL